MIEESQSSDINPERSQQGSSIIIKIVVSLGDQCKNNSNTGTMQYAQLKSKCKTESMSWYSYKFPSSKGQRQTVELAC